LLDIRTLALQVPVGAWVHLELPELVEHEAHQAQHPCQHEAHNDQDNALGTERLACAGVRGALAPRGARIAKALVALCICVPPANAVAIAECVARNTLEGAACKGLELHAVVARVGLHHAGGLKRGLVSQRSGALQLNGKSSVAAGAPNAIAINTRVRQHHAPGWLYGVCCKKRAE